MVNPEFWLSEIVAVPPVPSGGPPEDQTGWWGPLSGLWGWFGVAGVDSSLSPNPMFNPSPLSLLPHAGSVPSGLVEGCLSSRAETSGHASIIASGPEDQVERLLRVSYDPRNMEALDILDLQYNLLNI